MTTPVCTAAHRTLGLIILLSGWSIRWSVVHSLQVVHLYPNRSTGKPIPSTARYRCTTTDTAIPGQRSVTFGVGGPSSPRSAAAARGGNIGRCRTARNPVTLFQSAIPVEPATPTEDDDIDNDLSLGSRLNLLQQENQILRSTIEQLENSNQALENQRRIVIENFEGERAATDEPWWNGDATVSVSIAEVEECEEPNEDGTCPLEPDVSFQDALRDRAYWLVGLLALQSMSGFILARNELLLQTHPIIIYFLTMLVGAGGNAGNQASVRVIRGLALGNLNEASQRRFLNREFKMAIALSFVLSTAGFLRAVIFRTPIAETIAITLALSLIVFSSICLGAVLPLVLRNMKVDPAHSSTTIQVIMDILGVMLTVVVSSAILDSALGRQLVSKLVGGG